MIRAARSGDAPQLSQLAFRSKAHWGYSDAFMEACRDELSVSDAYLDANPTFVLEQGDGIAGFYALERPADTDVELGYLFVEPSAMRRGVGRRLMSHALERARALGYRRMLIQSDPNAEVFYLACGAVRTGSRPSESDGRPLPLLEIEVVGCDP